MAIVVFVSHGYGGYGDFMFGLKAANLVHKELKETIGVNEEIILVTQAVGKQQIQDLGGDKEFNVKVLSLEEFAAMRKEKEFKFDYFIEGPCFNPTAHAQLKIPAATPALMITEYNLDYEHLSPDEDICESLGLPDNVTLMKFITADLEKEGSERPVDVMHGGFGTAEDPRS